MFSVAWYLDLIKRIVAVTQPGYVRYRKGQIVIEHDGDELGTVPCEDIGALVLEHPQITITRGALSRCLEFNVVVLLCDERHMPVALLQPMQANTLHARTLRSQISVRESVHNRIWKQVISSKIRHQASIVDRYQGDARHLFSLAKRVSSGDKGNLESQAAKVYWRSLFGTEFRRRLDGDGINSLLNYGYAVIRASVARAVCAAGLHPALGIHHSNQYNAFALADDLMEPLRPVVDSVVFEIVSGGEAGGSIELNPDLKIQLLSLIAQECVIESRQMPLMVALQRYIASFRRVLFGEEKTIVFPTI